RHVVGGLDAPPGAHEVAHHVEQELPGDARPRQLAGAQVLAPRAALRQVRVAGKGGEVLVVRLADAARRPKVAVHLRPWVRAEEVDHRVAYAERGHRDDEAHRLPELARGLPREA